MQETSVSLIFLSFGALFLLIKSYAKILWREAALLAIISCGGWIWLTTEILSSFKMIDFQSILVVWLIPATLTTAVCWVKRKDIRKLPVIFPPLTLSEKALLSAVVLVLIGTGIIALGSPPNTWDSLTYHMSRVAHWIQNKTIAYYPAHIPRQLFYSPGQEYIILHFQVLLGSDRLASMVQWFCMVGSLIVVSLIARELGATRRGQWLSVVIAATIPMGIMQSNSVQGDYAATLWLASAIFFFMKKGINDWMKAIICGVSLGLAFLTKGTAVVFGLVIIIWMCIHALGSLSWKKIAGVGIVLFLVAFINAPFLCRNAQFFNNKLLGPITKEYEPAINDPVSWAGFFANVVRNMGTQLSMPNDTVNHLTERGFYNIAETFGINLNDASYTYGGQTFKMSPPSKNEDRTTNYFHFLIIIFLSILVFAKGQMKGLLAKYWFCLFGMACAFCVIVKWQSVTISRFHLPLFVLASSFCGVALEKNFNKKFALLIAAILFILTFPYICHAYPRRLIGEKSFFLKSRIEKYFLVNPGWKEAYVTATRDVRTSGCQNVGIDLGIDYWEYPLWVLLKEDNWEGRIECVNVINFTKEIKYPLGEFHPCRVIVIGNQPEDVRVLKTD